VRRRWPWILGAVVVAVAAFVLVWFQPQKLFIDETADEALPTVAATADEAEEVDQAPSTSSGPVEVARGDFVSLDHGTEGTVRVLDVGGGRQVVRLENLDTSNGPDLFVYLTANPSDGREGAFDDDYVDLGRLTANQGNQNYNVPAGTDLRQRPTVVIWCDRFDSAFGAADLTFA
jgi:hypothetical protein